MKVFEDEIRNLYQKEDRKIEGMIKNLVKQSLKEPLEDLELIRMTMDILNASLKNKNQSTESSNIKEINSIKSQL